MKKAKYIKVEAAVRYWDDATINGDNSESGDLVPFKIGDLWLPVIEIYTGKIIDWPQGSVADFHFKVCDAGTYHLLDENMEVIASREDNYVPDGLCHGDQGYGDYIIFSVDETGQILKYRNNIDLEDFEPA
jgi:hypothetical protein